jgi:hypothetical protein
VSEVVPPDLEAEAIKCLKTKIAELEQKIETLSPRKSGDEAPEATVSDPVDVFLHGAGI